LQLLSEPRVYRQFFKTKQEACLNKVRAETKDFVGLTQMTDKQGVFRNQVDETNTLNEGPIKIMQIFNPLFVKDENLNCKNDQRKIYISQLKDRLKIVNRTRPKVLVINGFIDDNCKKLIAKINVTIPVVINDGSDFFSFWICGIQGIVLRSADFFSHQGIKGEQIEWLKEELEQSRVARHRTFAFVDCDVTKVPPSWMKMLARGRTLCISGISTGDNIENIYTYIPVKKNLEVTEGISQELSLGESDDDDDDLQKYDVKIFARKSSSVLCIKINESGEWEGEYLD